MADPQEAELEVLIRARYPLIYLVTWEEGRAEAMLARLARKQGKGLYVWAATSGLRSALTDAAAQSADAKTVLQLAARSSESAVFVLKDFHAYLKEPQNVRALRDLVPQLKNSYKTVVILSPVMEIPVELEKDVTVVDYELPGAEELTALLGDIASAAKKGGGKFSVNLENGAGEKLVQAALGMTLSEAENALARAVVLDQALGPDDVDVILREKKQILRKARLLEYFEAREEFGQIGGMESLKDWLSKRGPAFAQKARDFGLPQPKGVLLLGVQGCGKSLTCKAIAGLWRMPLLRLDMGQIFGGFVGQSEENMRRAIRTAESVAPCVLWLDEIEKGLAGTGSSNTSDAGTTARVFSTLLTWLQEKAKPVFVAATANNIKELPPELLRKGRFDEIFFIDLPQAPERKAIFGIHIKKKGRDPARFDLDRLTALSEGFSGAEIEQAVVAALYDAFAQSREVAQPDMEAALSQTVPLSRTMSEDIASLRSWASTRARPASTNGKA